MLDFASEPPTFITDGLSRIDERRRSTTNDDQPRARAGMSQGSRARQDSSQGAKDPNQGEIAQNIVTKDARPLVIARVSSTCVTAGQAFTPPRPRCPRRRAFAAGSHPPVAPRSRCPHRRCECPLHRHLSCKPSSVKSPTTYTTGNANISSGETCSGQ